MFFFKRREMREPACDWESGVRAQRDRGLDGFGYPVAKTIYSQSQDIRGVILKRNDGFFQVMVEYLWPRSGRDLRHFGWEEIHWRSTEYKSVFDTMEKAEAYVLFQVEHMDYYLEDD